MLDSDMFLHPGRLYQTFYFQKMWDAPNCRILYTLLWELYLRLYNLHTGAIGDL